MQQFSSEKGKPRPHPLIHSSIFQVLDWESVYQSRIIPIPQFPPADPYSVNFIGRLANEILRMTDPRVTTYIDQMSAWYDKKTNLELVNLRLWEYLEVRSVYFSISLCTLYILVYCMCIFLVFFLIILYTIYILLYFTQNAVDIFGLSGLDRLFCFMIVREIQLFIKYFKR